MWASRRGEKQKRWRTWLERAGRRWMGETLGILRFAQDDGRNVQRHEQQSGGWVMVLHPTHPAPHPREDPDS
jgi:hypothetical protein